MAVVQEKKPKNPLEEIEQYRRLAQDCWDEINERQYALNEAKQSYNDALERIQTLMEEAKLLTEGVLPSSMPVVTKEATVVVPSIPTPKTVRAAKSEKSAPRKSEGNGRNYGNKITLPEAIWDVLDRDPKQYKSLVEDYPDDAVGLTPSEIKEVIEKEKKWISSSDPHQQIQATVGQLRHEGKLGRGNSSRYFIVENAELYGPCLNSDGSLMKQNEDGTYTTKEGQIFVWPDGKPVKQRKRRAKVSEEK